MEQKQDIRVIKTQRALAEALMSLLEKKRFSKITVNDICIAAMVSRSTFYLHFEDKHQLLAHCLREESERLRAAYPPGSVQEVILHTLRNVKERERIYRNLFSADADKEITQMFQQHFLEVTLKEFDAMHKQGIALKGQVPLLAAFYAGGIAGTVVWWVKNGYPVPVEEIAGCQYELLGTALKQIP